MASSTRYLSAVCVVILSTGLGCSRASGGTASKEEPAAQKKALVGDEELVKAAERWVDQEFQPSTLTREQQLAEMKWFRDAAKPFRMPVQWVNRPNLDFRGYAGQIAGGRIRAGDPVRLLPSGRTTTVARIVTMGGDLDEAAAGQSVTLTFADEVDCSRGDVIAAAKAPPHAADTPPSAI